MKHSRSAGTISTGDVFFLANLPLEASISVKVTCQLGLHEQALPSSLANTATKKTFWTTILVFSDSVTSDAVLIHKVGKSRYSFSKTGSNGSG
jgi:hypothetical protein